jgi:hypothetical protein
MEDKRRREDDRATKRKDKKERCLYLYSAPIRVWIFSFQRYLIGRSGLSVAMD